MIAVILLQINILTLTLFSVLLCAIRKKMQESEGEVSLVQPGIRNAHMGPLMPGSNPMGKPINDDFCVGVPPPHIPLADKSDERTLADIESIQSEKTMIRDKKNKIATNPTKPKLSAVPLLNKEGNPGPKQTNPIVALKREQEQKRAKPGTVINP